MPDAPSNWTARQWLDWLGDGRVVKLPTALQSCAAVLGEILLPTDADADHVVGQLRVMLDREEFIRDRVGQEGCRARLEATDNCIALEKAIALLNRAAPD